jgi:hypothetical protein
MEPAEHGFGQAAKADERDAGRAVRRMFALERTEEVGCVEWYQYPGTVDKKGATLSERGLPPRW